MKESKPNLQNIPIRTESGKRIRDAFVSPTPLLSANYTALETRILEPGEPFRTSQDMKYTLGAVSFAEEWPEEGRPDAFRVLPICGRERQDLLRKARDHHPLPEGVILVGQQAGGNYKRIYPWQVDWRGLRNPGEP